MPSSPWPPIRWTSSCAARPPSRRTPSPAHRGSSSRSRGRSGALRPRLLLYGGAALSDADASRLRARFPEARLAAFYPTTDAGALGVAPTGDGVYRTFTETHLVEVLDDDGRPVAVGAPR